MSRLVKSVVLCFVGDSSGEITTCLSANEFYGFLHRKTILAVVVGREEPI